MSINFIVYGEPVAKGRPRFARSGHCYTPQKTLFAESKFGNAAKIAFGYNHEPITGPVRAHMNFVFGMPKSWPIGKRELMNGLPCAKKPDLDNLIKLLDGINGKGIWGDDSQVVEIYARKVWGATPRTEIQIITLEEQAGKTAKNKATGAAICSRGDKADNSFSTPPVAFFQPEKGNNEGE